MSLTLDEMDALSDWKPFRRKVRVAMIKAATDVTTETYDENYNSMYQKRNTLAAIILNSPDGKLESFCIACAAQNTLDTTSSDNDIQFTVNGLFNAVAGVLSNELPELPE